jgi:hypothetical protein
LGALTWSDQDFAASLCEQFDRKDCLTERKWHCLIALARRGRGLMGMRELPRCYGRGVVKDDGGPEAG